MTLWSLCGLNSEITESNIRNIPHISDLCKPLTFSRCGFLIRQSLISAELVAIGKRHVDASLSEVNKGNSIFNLNHSNNSIKLWLKCQAQIT